MGFALFGPYSPNPDGIVVADFNHDGHPDIVTADLEGSFSVLLGAGSGFAAAAVYPTSPCQISTSVAVADFDGDGRLDLMFNDTFKGGQICLLLGNGDGTFQPATSISVPALVNWVAAADVNHDGKPDLILATNADVSVLPGNGGGAFGPPINLGIGPTSYVVTANFNQDGNVDIAALTSVPFGSTADLLVLLGAGDGTFKSSGEYDLGTDATAIAVGDLNGDNHTDIAVAGGAAVMLLFGNGDGAFQAPVSVGTVGAYALAVGDVNGDGVNDIVATGTEIVQNTPEPAVFVLLGNGGGTFRGPESYIVDSAPTFVVLGDFNHDGRPDIACSAENAGISVLLNTGQGKFEHSNAFHATKHSNFVSAGDLNGDGLPDLIVTDSGSLTYPMAVLLNKGHGTFGAPAIIDLPDTPGSPVALGDFNGDGKLDFAANVANSFGFTGVAVALGNGDGAFQPLKTYATPLNADVVIAGDFNREGNLDLAVATYAKGVAQLSVLLGSGDGTFQTAVNSPLPAQARTMVAGDFNGDGILDVASVSSYGEVSISLGNGDGTFHPAKTFQLGVDVSSMTAADLKGDGILDLAIVSQPGTLSGARVLVTLGNGDGTFQAPASWFAGWSAFQVVAGDFNRDGKMDLAISNSALLSSNPSDADIGILLGNGDGTFQPVQLFGMAGQPRGLAAADVMGNGKLSIVAGCDVSGACVLLNTTK